MVEGRRGHARGALRHRVISKLLPELQRGSGLVRAQRRLERPGHARHPRSASDASRDPKDLAYGEILERMENHTYAVEAAEILRRLGASVARGGKHAVRSPIDGS